MLPVFAKTNGLGKFLPRFSDVSTQKGGLSQGRKGVFEIPFVGGKSTADARVSRQIIGVVMKI